MIICKFGGSSIATPDNIMKIADLVINKSKIDRIVCVFSAMGKTTDNLIQLGKLTQTDVKASIKILDDIKAFHIGFIDKLFPHHNIDNIRILEFLTRKFEDLFTFCMGAHYLNDFSRKTQDKIISYGELLSNYIIYSYIVSTNCSSKPIAFVDTRQIIKTNSNYTNAKVESDITNENIKMLIDENSEKDIFIVTGFISSDLRGNTTTLGRGGGDYTAAIFGCALDADIVEIYTDVDGIMTSDPRKVDNAFTIPRLSYNEMLELSHYGANVIYTPTILPLYRKNIPIVVKNTNNPNCRGTYIDTSMVKTDNIATAISTIDNIGFFKIYGTYLIGKIGFSGNLFSLFSKHNINIILISQSSCEHSIYIATYKNDLNKTLDVLNSEYRDNIENGTLCIDNLIDKSIIAIETSNQKNILEILNITIPLLYKKNIDIYTQTTSDHNICLVIDKNKIDNTVKMLHNNLFLSTYKHVFLIGCGLVGKSLIKLLLSDTVSKYNIVSVSNSKKTLFPRYENPDIGNLSTLINSNGIQLTTEDLINRIVKLNMANSIVIDCTSSDAIYPYYSKLLNNNIGVVTPNKKANTTNIELFNTLTKYHNYRYETTVGAGLPILQTIENIINSGDKIISIEAILSGSLSYIFTEYVKQDKQFSDIVKRAQELGYTEPNPKDDLDGMDMVRKTLIIMRMLGHKTSLENIDNKTFLSKECLESDSIETFYKNLELYDESMEKTKTNGIKNNTKPKIVSKIKDNIGSVGLEYYDSSHPFYTLEGSSNMVVIKTNYYFDNPIVISGPGAGAIVTAAGIISDMAKI